MSRWEPGAGCELRCEITRWVSEDPQPGVVEARFVDAAGSTWVFHEKTAMFPNWDALGPDADYPLASAIAARVLAVATGADGSTLITVTTAWPWHISSVDGC